MTGEASHARFPATPTRFHCRLAAIFSRVGREATLMIFTEFEDASSGWLSSWLD